MALETRKHIIIEPPTHLSEYSESETTYAKSSGKLSPTNSRGSSDSICLSRSSEFLAKNHSINVVENFSSTKSNYLIPNHKKTLRHVNTLQYHKASNYIQSENTQNGSPETEKQKIISSIIFDSEHSPAGYSSSELTYKTDNTEQISSLNDPFINIQQNYNLQSESPTLLSKAMFYYNSKKSSVTDFLTSYKKQKLKIPKTNKRYFKKRRNSIGISPEVETNVKNWPLISRLLFHLVSSVGLKNRVYSKNSTLALALLSFAYFISCLIKVLVNKVIEEKLMFGFPQVISGFSHVMTAVLIEVFTNKYGLFTRTSETINFVHLIPLATWNIVNTLLEHYSLIHNSVIPSYQHFKSMEILAVMGLMLFFTKPKYSRKSWFYAGIICAGSALASVTGYFGYYDTSINTLGILFAASSLVSRSAYYIYLYSYMQQNQYNYMTFLRFYAPVCGMVSFLSLPLSSDLLSFMRYDLKIIPALALIGVSALGACVNMTTFILLMRIGPLSLCATFQLRMCFLLIYGYFVFKFPLYSYNYIGILICVYGAYKWFSLRGYSSHSSGRRSYLLPFQTKL
ncbi:hypothetical protein BB559_001400 [Furculomyces boomerangus]|uniref:GDP-mannose transporter n=1 Tax=Furculomyces boomerangus TaxID=61424 RepID=A0A2T9Z242_9FUNG|nr:hypothetical protein BB559_004154 [Furculomyces boomerangus]PVU98668.1 hypothetical protein BB559_001400 [Furculomyces boomerangus]